MQRLFVTLSYKHQQHHHSPSSAQQQKQEEQKKDLINFILFMEVNQINKSFE